MNKKLLVTLLHKNLEELSMITASFSELDEYPQTIVQLARRKTEDIQMLLDELGAIQPVVVPQVVDAPSQSDFVVEDIAEHVEPKADLEAIVTDLDTISTEPVLSTIEIDALPDLTFATDENELANEEEEEVDKYDEDEEEDDEDDESIIIVPIAPETVLVNEIRHVENVESILKEIEISEAPLEVPLEEISKAQEVKEEVMPEPIEIQEEEQPIILPESAELESVVVNEIAPHEVQTPTEEAKRMTISEKMGLHNTSRNDAMINSQNSISASIANKKITDIKQALSIGDRFRFQRELFKSNGEDMNRTLTYLNLLATQSEAMAFLQSKYGWDETSEAAIDFYQLVKRKFL